MDIELIAWQHVQGCIGREGEAERFRVVGVREDGREWVQARRGGLDARDPAHRELVPQKNPGSVPHPSARLKKKQHGRPHT